MTFVCDTGTRYLSKVYNDGWMVDQGLLQRADYLFLPCGLIEGGDPSSPVAPVVSNAWLNAHGYRPGSVQQFPGLGRCLLPRAVAPPR